MSTTNTNRKRQQVQHLFWRVGFGATPAVIRRESRKPIRQVVRDLLKDSDAFTPLTVMEPEPVLSQQAPQGTLHNEMEDRDALRGGIKENNRRIRDLNAQWLERLASGEGVLREKMAYFWHGHFACRVRNPLMAERYVNTLRQYALGTFGDLLLAVSREPAMLRFLNNQQNRKNAPNENFAREVMELFTLGHGSPGQENYTEQDIREAARAFTGWGFTRQGEFIFRANQHDDGTKTLFGKTGNFTGEDAIRLLLERKETALFITTKLYRFLVDEQPVLAPTAVQHINQLADRFYRNKYDIKDLLETIVTADWFYDSRCIGTRIKSPVELIAGMQHTLGIRVEQKQILLHVQRVLGQVLLSPPNVAGWPGGRSWIDSSSLLFRMKLPDLLLRGHQVSVRPKDDGDANTELLDQKQPKALNVIVDWDAFEKAFELVRVEQLPEALAMYLLQQRLPLAQRMLVEQELKPARSRSEQIRRLTATLMALPEYQLC